MTPWYKRLPERLRLETKLVKKVYPSARFVQNKGLLEIYVNIRGRRRTYTAQVVYPHDFPYRPPVAYIVRPKLLHEPHMYRGGALCLYDAPDVGPQTSGKVVIDWVCGWIRSYEEFRRSGHWPDENKWKF